MKAAAFLFLLVILGFTAWQRKHFLDELRPGLLEGASAQLKVAGYDVVVTAPTGMDAALVGVVPEPEDRETARRLVDGIQGLRALPEQNRLQIPGRLRLRLEPGTSRLKLTGRLGDVEGGKRLVMALQEISSIDFVDVSGFVFQEMVADLPYLDSEPFLTLCQTFFDLPGNGELVATEAGISMKGAATVQAREAWAEAESELASKVNPAAAAAAVRMARDTGWPPGMAHDRFRIHLEVGYQPSPLHLPGYQPDAPLQAERLRNLVAVLERSEVIFAPGAVEPGAEQTGKLEAAARAMQSAGERVRYVVGGHCLESKDGAGEPTRQALALAEAVVAHLEALGIPRERMEPAVFASPAGSGPAEAPRFRKVEIRVR